MTFTYTYRSSDGQRHTAEIEAENRDAAFAKVRSELGVKPIKVVAAAPGGDGQLASRRVSELASSDARGNSTISHFHIHLAAAILVLAAIIAGGWWLLRRDEDIAPYQIMTPNGPATLAVAAPLPRQAIPGDRRRVDAARETAFRLPAERHLARFAEPGRAVPTSSDGGPAYRPPAEAEFRVALREPVRVASTDFTEVVDLKRIVAGMKREMAAYLAGGGTVEGYLAELERRQKLEISYRENAERRLGELLSRTPANSSAFAKATADKPTHSPAPNSSTHPLPHSPTLNSHPSQLANSQTRKLANSLSSAYAYWLKANAQLKSMGIYELPLPDALRSYQAGLDLDE